jgi:hypothetical protein
MHEAYQLRDAFRQCFWDEDLGVFVNGVVDGRKTGRWGCHENALALLYGLATKAQKERIFQRFRQENLEDVFVPDDKDYDIEVAACGKMPTVSLALSRYRWPDGKMVPIGTPYFAAYWLEALCQAGLVEEAQRFIENRWGDLARQGATSVWETWDMRQSLSHAWSCCPAVLAVRYFSGIRRLDLSGVRYSVLPAPGLLKHIQGRVVTRLGALQVEWRENNLTVDVPSGIEVEAGLPHDEGAVLLVNGEPYENVKESEGSGRKYLTAMLKPGRSIVSFEKCQNNAVAGVDRSGENRRESE